MTFKPKGCTIMCGLFVYNDAKLPVSVSSKAKKFFEFCERWVTVVPGDAVGVLVQATTDIVVLNAYLGKNGASFTALIGHNFQLDLNIEKLCHLPRTN